MNSRHACLFSEFRVFRVFRVFRGSSSNKKIVTVPNLGAECRGISDKSCTFLLPSFAAFATFAIARPEGPSRETPFFMKIRLPLTRVNSG